jgi:ferredoxin
MSRLGGWQSVRVYIDRDLCTGHGRCYSLAPEVFEPDDAGNGLVINDDLAEELRWRALAGVWNCLERAISIRD